MRRRAGIRAGGRDRTLLLWAPLAVALWSAAAHGGDVPDWVRTPPSDSPAFMYGTGEGADRDAAKNAALADIAGTLMTRVQSDQVVVQRQRGSEFSESLDSRIATQVEEIELSHYEVTETERSGGRWFALVRLSRPRFIETKRLALEEKDADLRQHIARQDGQSKLRRWLEAPTTRAKIADAWALVEVLRSVDPAFDGRAHTRRYLGYLDAVEKTADQVGVRVACDDGSSAFARKLANLLAGEHLHATVNAAKPGAATIRLRSRVEETEIFGTKRVKLTVMLTTVDDAGVELATVERSAHADSMTSHETALKIASNDLAEQCEGDGVFSCLGLAEAR